MGFGGGAYFGGNAATGQPAYSAWDINNSMGWNPNAAAFNPWANTPGGFGGQTDYYSALGAAYGRQTGGFGGGGYDPAAWATPSGAVEYGGGLPGIPYQDPFGGGGGGGGDAPRFDPWTGEYLGGGTGSDAHYGPQPQPQPAPNPYAGMILGPQANPSYFNPATYAGDKGNYGIPYKGASQPGDIGFSKQSPMPNLGYNPGMENWFANSGMSGGGFQSRFGMGFPNAGTPSQYAPGAQMPPGFSGAYSFDNQSGALPLGSDPDLFKIIPGGG
jgi:hypothetical protein